MGETIEVKLSLITQHAKRALSRLRQDRKKTRTTARSRIQTAARARTKKLLGAAAGYASVSRVTSKLRAGSAPVDPWEQALVPLVAQVQAAVDEKVGFSAKARRSARNDTVAALGLSVGLGTSVTHAKEFFEVRNRVRQKEEKGRNVVRQAIKGPSLDELVIAATKGYFELSGRAWAYFWNSIFG